MLLNIEKIKMSHIIYAFIGASFLWPWNALLTASVLVKQKLADNPLVLANYSSSVMITSTVISLAANAVLLSLRADYPGRVRKGEYVIFTSFLLFGIFGNVSTGIPWFLLLLSVTACSSIGCALVQNGSLAITQRMPGSSYALSIMVGQGIAGVVPPLVPMIVGNADVAVIAVLTFFSVSVLALTAYIFFNMKENLRYVEIAEADMAYKFPERQELLIASKKIWGPIVTILLGFGASLSYPVFANMVESHSISVHVFSPLTHLVWNAGDLLGRVICLAPKTHLRSSESMVVFSALRFLIIGLLIVLVHLGNPSDTLYLLTMLVYGITGGFLISNAIAFSPSCVPQHLQPAVGEIISLAIAVGLAFGSAVSFITAALI